MTSFWFFCQSGESCLHAACKYGHVSVVDYLTTIHTSLDLRDQVLIMHYSLGKQTLQMPYLNSKVNKNWKILSLRKNKTLCQLRGETWYGIFFCFVCLDCFYWVYFCLPFIFYQHQDTALHIATWHGFPRIVRSLCKAGASVTYQNEVINIFDFSQDDCSKI